MNPSHRSASAALLLLVGLAITATVSGPAFADGRQGPPRVFPADTWQAMTPDELNLDDAKLQQFITNLQGKTPDKSSGVIIRHGYVAATWGRQEWRYGWASSSKPMISTMLFFAIDRGLLKSVDDRVGDWGWQLSAKDQPMTFAHLGNMISGYAVAEAPGTAWAYNDFAIQLYWKTMERVLGRTLNEAALDWLAPLKFEDGNIFDARRRVQTTPRDFARIGWFWMSHGNWNGQQLLPASYFERYMKPQVPVDMPLSQSHEANDYLGIESYGGIPKPTVWGPGKYGYNWWFNGPEKGVEGRILPDAPADIVMTIGRGGNYMVMFPSQDLLVAGRGDWGHPMPGPEREKFNANLKLLMEALLDGSCGCWVEDGPATQPAESASQPATQQP